MFTITVLFAVLFVCALP
ncbi:hypothetical protein AVEN_55178-1, partial [Araneus ventricosus]